jgi:hypothetical protein
MTRKLSTFIAKHTAAKCKGLTYHQKIAAGKLSPNGARIYKKSPIAKKITAITAEYHKMKAKADAVWSSMIPLHNLLPVVVKRDLTLWHLPVKDRVRACDYAPWCIVIERNGQPWCRAVKTGEREMRMMPTGNPLCFTRENVEKHIAWAVQCAQDGAAKLSALSGNAEVMTVKVVHMDLWSRYQTLIMRASQFLTDAFVSTPVTKA